MKLMARQVRPWLTKPAQSLAFRMRLNDRGVNQQIPSGTMANRHTQKVRMYGCNLLLFTINRLRAWQTRGVHVGFAYLVAIMDWASRKVLAWRISNTLTTDFCIEALQEALGRYGTPEIFNTDQGSQFASEDFTDVLKENGIQISMDGKGRWVDNVFVERLWRSVKYENVYLRAYESMAALREGIKDYFLFYNTKRTHQSLANQTPDEVYFKDDGLKEAA